MKSLDDNHILSRILEAKRIQLNDLKMRVPGAIVRKMATMSESVPSFKNAIELTGRTCIIAEIKKASPSKGVLIDALHVDELAVKYRDAGASAISVVTEGDFFSGDLAWVQTVAKASGLPVLRKDFVVEDYQVWETRAAGASAILLIAAILKPEALQSLLKFAEQVGLDVLVEVHDEKELEEALWAGASIVGVNNRDLRTFEVDLDTSVRLGALIPEDKLFVAESGIHKKDDIEKLERAGANAFLIGEHLLTASDPGCALEDLL